MSEDPSPTDGEYVIQAIYAVAEAIRELPAATLEHQERSELLKVATAFKAASWANPAQYSPIDDEHAVDMAGRLLKAVAAKCAKPYETCHCGACIDPAVATCGPSPIRVKPEPVAWRFAFPSGGQTITTSPDSYDPGTYSQRTPLYEPEDA